MKKYLITDPHYYTTKPDTFKEALNRSLIKYKPDFVCFRDKSEGDKKELLDAFKESCKEGGFCSLVNGSIELAIAYGFDGVHLRSDQGDLANLAKQNALMCIVSCHNVDEVKLALDEGADFVTLSPLFDSPGKVDAIGMEAFARMLKEIDRSRVFALGGIDDDKKIKEVEKLEVFGFASIRYFTK